MGRFINKLLFLKVGILCSLFAIVFAKPIKSFGQNRNYYTPGRLLDTVIDYLGHKYSLGEIAINDTFRSAAKGLYNPEGDEIASCSSGYFQMYLEPGCGLEGTSTANVARRNVVCQVLQDISQFIHSPLTTSLTGQKINIWVRCPDSVGWLPPNYAGVAASFYNVPSSTTISGIQDNAVWITLNSGTDAYRNVTSPLYTAGGTYSYGATFFHGWMAFKFDGSIAWNTSLTSTPGLDTVDLYSVALHEMLHALGFMTLIDYNGQSRLGAGFNYFTRYDAHLQTNNTWIPLIKTSDVCDLYQWGFNTSLTPSTVLSPGGTLGCPVGYDTGVYIDDTVCTNAVQYVDGSLTQPVYTPNCYQRGSSLSHFDDLCKVPSTFVLSPPLSDHQYFVMSNAIVPGPYLPVTNPGAMRRYPKPEERQVLCDIGYIVDTTFGNSTDLNFNNYHTTVCGNQIAGIDDGIDSPGVFEFFTTAGVPVTINGGAFPSLLANDFNADSFKCLEVIEGSGTLSATSGNSSTVITFTPTLGTYGIQLLRYIPVNTSTGAIGNITYVYAYVGDASCTPSACDLVSNGGFENVDSPACNDIDALVHCWSSYIGTPDIFSRSGCAPSSSIPNAYFRAPATDVHLSSALPNNHFLGFQSYWLGAVQISESPQSPLSSSLVAGNTYLVGLWAKLANSAGFSPTTTHLQLAVSTSIPPLPPYLGLVGPLPPGLIPLCAFNISQPDTAWHYYWQYVPYTGLTANTLIILPAQYLDGSTSFLQSYYIIDDVSIIPASTLPTFSVPNVICKGEIINLDTTVNIPGGTFSWLTDSLGYLVTSYDSIFNSDSAYQASILSGEGGYSIICYTYTNNLGCIVKIYDTIHIYLPPVPIIGVPSLCIGAVTIYTDASIGGTWSSSNTAIVTVGASTGIITSMSPGVDTITYSIGTSCSVYKILTVNPLPSVITGIKKMCVGSSTTLSDSVASGSWHSLNTGIATIDIYYGIVTGIAPGTDTITFTNIYGCSVFTIVTVNPLPTSILGSSTACVGYANTLTDGTPGGTWFSSNPTIAIVGAVTGIVTGVSPGMDTITYMLPDSCTVSMTIWVNPLPFPIYGADVLCVGSSITLFDDMSGGTWSSSNTNATVGAGTGIVTGITAGVDTIYYTAGWGCFSYYIITVNPLPASITGASSLCAGATTSLSDASIGGTWNSINPSIASIGVGTGIVFGIYPGVDTISYTLGTGCATTFTVTVMPAPSSIVGPDSVCIGSFINLADTGSGVYTTFSSNITLTGGGYCVGVSAGMAIITFTMTGGCFTLDTITVNPLPATISGSLNVCVGLNDTLTDAGGGTWISSNTGIATIGFTTGIVTGISPGVDTITYTLHTGCSITAVITVNPLPLAITGASSACLGTSDTLSDATVGGTWTSSNTSIATISATTGIVTTVTSGTTTISYTMPTGCYATLTFYVDSLPLVPPITGGDSICVGDSIALSDTYPGGYWGSLTPGIASVDYMTAVVTGLTQGLAVIYYVNTDICGISIVYDTIVVVDSFPPITGIMAVCSGLTDTLTNFVAGGIWTSSNTAIATVNATTGVVTGVSSGTVTISYSATGPCGPFVATTNVIVNLAPFITTNTIVACQTLATSGGDGAGPGGGIVSGFPGCIEVCDSSLIRYYAHGVAGSVYTWVVTGGSLVTNYGDSIDVFWPIAGTTGSITLYDSISHCSGTASVTCIKVISKPHAYFGESSLTACLGETIYFFDSSSADSTSPIVSWIWNFGDSTGSTIKNTNHTYSVTGLYTVTLVVKNACSCTDTYRIKIQVFENPGPTIQCASIVCDSGIATYSTAVDGCGTYNWTVIGGTILSGFGSNIITVKWNSIGPDGFGYVQLMEPCALCPDTITLKIPVILQNATIEGPGTACAGEQFEYELPLWAATQYMWGVLGDSGAVIGYRDNYKVVVQFPGPGTYTLHGWYQNRIMLCGGNVYKTITVVPQIHINGLTAVCPGTYTYNIPAMYTGIWTVLDSTGAVYPSTPGASSVTINFVPGTYHLSVSGSFCAPPLTITVQGNPPPIDSMKGPDTVCLGRVYTYAAFTHTPGYICNWQITGGTLVPMSGRDSVTVVWTSTGTKTISVNLESIISPYCQGNVTTLNVIQELVNPNITGPNHVCANSSHNYTCNYTRGEVYNWKIIPNTAGSVITGNYTPNISVQWNNNTSVITASVIVSITKCDVTVLDTLLVTVNPSPTVTLTSSPNPGCPNTPITFVATTGGSYYTFAWGDGSPNTVGSASTVIHGFPLNPTTANIIYHVTVAVTPGGGGCPPIGSTSLYEAIKPGPIAYASTADNINLCPTTNALIVGTVTNNVSGLTYQWYGTGVPPGSTDTFYTSTWAPLPSSYGIWFEVTASNGCMTQSNHIVLHNLDSCDMLGVGLGGGVDSPGGGSCVIYYSATDSCGVLTLSADTLVSGSWRADITPPGGPLQLDTNFVTCTYNDPGIYKFNFLSAPSGCHADSIIADTLGIIPDFRWVLHCGTGGFDSVFLTDLSAYVPWWHIDSIAWDTGIVRIGGGPNLSLSLAAPGTYTVFETVYGTDPDGLFNCSAIHNIILPGPPNAVFTDTSSPICTGIPIKFTPISPAGIANFNWDFGDGSGILISNPLKTYTFAGSIDPMIKTVKLTVTDSIGCKDSTTQNVVIYDNLLNGDLNLPTLISACSNDVPIILSWHNIGIVPDSFIWSNGVTNTTGFDTVHASGPYWVTVFDNHKCRQTDPLPVKEVRIITPPIPSISGKQIFCAPNAVQLSGYLGSGVTYNWFRNGSSTGVITPTINDAVPASDYYYQLVIGVFDSTSDSTCYSSSAVDSIQVLPPPPSPVITVPNILNCATYQIALSASNSEFGYFNWSDGHYGAYDTINSGGPYQVMFTDMNGCSSYANVGVPLSPETYFQYFPTGCYNICTQQLPLLLYGPPDDTFSYWAWLDDTTTELSGSGLMAPYSIGSSGTYYWTLDPGLCTATSSGMTVSVSECNGCKQTRLSAVATCTSGNPASYSIVVSFNSLGPGTYTLGTDIGPIDPFSGTIVGGSYSLTLTFTTLVVPPPDSVTVELLIREHDGSMCFSKIRIPLDTCSWIEERMVHSPDSSSGSHINLQTDIASALLVFPNPSSGDVTAAYEYGTVGNNNRSLTVFDAVGRKMAYIAPQDSHGTWLINTNSWAVGMYIIQMASDGKPLQTQRIVITGK